MLTEADAGHVSPSSSPPRTPPAPPTPDAPTHRGRDRPDARRRPRARRPPPRRPRRRRPRRRHAAHDRRRVPRRRPAPAGGGGAAGGFLGDLGSVPGSLVSDTSCQQLAGNAKYRRLKVRGVGTVRVRAYTAGPATTLTPILVTTADQPRQGQVGPLHDRRPRAARRPQAALQRRDHAVAAAAASAYHKLKATVTGKGKRKRASRSSLKLKTVSCRTLFTAQRWRTKAGAGLRLRVDARTALDRLAFKVPAALLPRQTAKRPHDRLHARLRRRPEPAQALRAQARRKGRGSCLVKARGRPWSARPRRPPVRGLPARSAVVELTLYRVTTRDGATRRKRYRLKASVLRPGARALSLSVRPRAPR